MLWFDEVNLNRRQKIAINLMRNDLRFVFTIMKNKSQVTPNYYVASLPYFGLITSGIENWIRTYNSSTAGIKLPLPVFEEEEGQFYEALRESVKFWDGKYADIYSVLKTEYENAETHFSDRCKPVAKLLRLYDFIGVDTVNGLAYGNTILYGAFIPGFSYKTFDGKTIKSYAQIAGVYTRLFDALWEYSVNDSYRFSFKDYGGLSILPFGNNFNDDFVIFSLLCQIRFILYCVNEYILDECSTKIRFTYILYYYLTTFIPEISIEKNGINFHIGNEYANRNFRNAMAHYGIGPALNENEIIEEDILFGLTEKILGVTTAEMHNAVLEELGELEIQLARHLGI